MEEKRERKVLLLYMQGKCVQIMKTTEDRCFCIDVE